MITNVSHYLRRRADAEPDGLAAAVAGDGGFTQLTYAELEDLTHIAMAELSRCGIRSGMRTVLMVKPSPQFFALCFAMLRMGVIMIMVDPGMGVANLGKCLKDAAPEAFVGIPRAHLARAVLGWGRRSLRVFGVVGGAFPGAHRIRLRRGERAHQTRDPIPGAQDPAAILFTSGSTGTPKGVMYRQATFIAQIESLQAKLGFQQGERDLSTFPLFALFAPAFGMASIVPHMDASRPMRADPAALVDAIKTFECTNLFLNPALMDKLGRHLDTQREELPTVRRVLSAGAPIPPAVFARFASRLSEDARIFSAYGATEALPIAFATYRELAGECVARTEQGEGVCVGYPIDEVDVRIAPIADGPIGSVDSLARNEVGEICVRGPMVTEGYFGRPDETKHAKVRSDRGLWHRMGDAGYFDAEGRLWMCGRIAHRVHTADTTLYSVCAEALANRRPELRRSALVPFHGGAALVLEPEARLSRDAQLRTVAALRERLAGHPRADGISHVLWAKHPFPVDARHNAKIRREELAVWAQKAPKSRVDLL